MRLWEVKVLNLLFSSCESVVWIVNWNYLFFINTFASQRLVFEGKRNYFSSKMHQILINFLVKIVIQKMRCQIWCICKEKWFIFFIKNKTLRSESVEECVNLPFYIFYNINIVIKSKLLFVDNFCVVIIVQIYYVYTIIINLFCC